MKININPPKETWSMLTQRPELELDYLDSTVRNILTRVKKSGDYALKEFARQFDKVTLDSLEATPQEIQAAVANTPPALATAIRTAYQNIKIFHQAQQANTLVVETMPGVICQRKAVAIEKVGIYIPGGTAPLFSTVLMLGVPAQLAGCQEIILCTPPAENGSINPAILFAANLVGIKKIFKVGGAQAIAAMAYGTESIPSVYKIFGPGNQYVTKAKQLVTMEGMAIDMPAGPSEVLVYADAQANPVFLAADLLSQAEHGADSQVVLVSTSSDIFKTVEVELAKQLEKLPRKALAEESLKHSLFVQLPNASEAFDFINAYAPEHLIINAVNADALLDQVKNAGSVFLGAYSPESAGDYASGTNHTLPTNGFAKAYSGVSLSSFQKFITVQSITQAGLKNLGPAVIAMAEAENLSGHAEAVRVRFNAMS